MADDCPWSGGQQLLLFLLFWWQASVRNKAWNAQLGAPKAQSCLAGQPSRFAVQPSALSQGRGLSCGLEGICRDSGARAARRRRLRRSARSWEKVLDLVACGTCLAAAARALAVKVGPYGSRISQTSRGDHLGGSGPDGGLWCARVSSLLQRRAPSVGRL